MRFSLWQKVVLGGGLVALWSLGLFILQDIRPDYQVVADVSRINDLQDSVAEKELEIIELTKKVAPPATLQISEEPKQTSPCYPYECFTGPEFISVYEKFENKVLGDPVHKYVFNKEEVDEYIWEIAEDMGYQKRGFADESDLVLFEERLIQPEARDSFIKMRAAIKEEGIALHLVSAYRTSNDQRYIFKNKLGKYNESGLLKGEFDDELKQVLKTSSIPGYSKHHSGFTVDFGCGNDYLVYTFSDTPCYAWMSENNFANSKKYGFIPSYPYDAKKQGPAPEPWEYVWVPQSYLK